MGDGRNGLATDKRGVPVFTLGDDEVVRLITQRISLSDDIGFEPEEILNISTRIL